MSGSIEFIAGNKSKIFKDILFHINEDLTFYGLPKYEPNYNLYEDIKNRKIILPSKDDLPGIDLSLSKKRILHKLKTIAIELEYNPNWTLEDDSIFIGEPIYPDLFKEVFGSKQSHFILHSDCCGYYVPMDFQATSVPNNFLASLGSSFTLLNELREIAGKLKLRIEDYTPNLNELREQRFDELADASLCDEKFMLLELYNIALASIKYNLLISFN